MNGILKAVRATTNSDQHLAKLLSLREQLNIRVTGTDRSIDFEQEPEIIDNETFDNRIWLVTLELNRQRIIALNHRAIQKLSVETNKPGMRLPNLVHNREAIVRSAAKTVALFEDLLSADLLRYTHSFLLVTPITYSHFAHI